MFQTEDTGHCTGGGVEDAECAVAVGYDEATQPRKNQGELPGLCELWSPRRPVVGRDVGELARREGTSELCSESNLREREYVCSY